MTTDDMLREEEAMLAAIREDPEAFEEGFLRLELALDLTPGTEIEGEEE